MEDLKKLLKDRHSYYNKRKIRIEKDLSPLPKGTVSKRKISHQYYYYLSFRNGKNVDNKYIGKEEPKQLIKQINKRRLLEKELREAKKALKMLRSVRPKIR